jgi:type IV pilus assembly protein PilW
MVAVAIGLFLTAVIGSYMVASMRTNEATQHIGEMQERARVALYLISSDLKQVGFWGDFTGNSMISGTDLTVTSAMETDCGIGLSDGSFIGTFPDPHGYFFPLWAEPVADSHGTASGFDCIESASRELVVGSDVISIKRLIGSADPSIATNRHYFAANTQEAEIFPGDGSEPSFSNQQVWEYQHHIYFIDSLEGTPSLRRYYLSNNDSSLGTMSGVAMGTLVDGIEYMRILFGVDTSSDADGIIDSFVSSGNVDYQYWADGRVLGGKVFLLVRSLTEDANYTNNTSYILGDTTISGEGDHYRRMLVENVISFRNIAISLEADL